MTTRCTRADDLPRAAIVQTIQSKLESHQTLYANLPPLELTNVWVNGSFGANSATETSDVDITIEVGTTTEPSDMSQLALADKITDLGGPTARALFPIVHRDCDVTVIPAGQILSALSADVPSARTHIKTSQQHGDHETAYDLLNARYIGV